MTEAGALRYLPLALAFVVWFLVVPFFDDWPWAVSLLDIFLIFTLSFSLYSVKAERKKLLVKAAMAAPIVMLFAYRLFDSNDTTLVIMLVFLILFFANSFMQILLGVFRSRTISADVMLGASCSYLILGLLFALLYIICETLQPGSFSGINTAESSLDQNRALMYFSYVTLTTLGYGDISPISSIARSFASFEAIVGQLYLTILVAILVSDYVSNRHNEENS